MKIPFANLFSRKKRLKAAPPPKIEAPMPTAKKAEGERLAKTVMPSAARAFAPEGEVEEAATTETARVAEAGKPAAVVQVSNLQPEGTGKLETCPTSPAPAKISMGASTAGPAPNLPPAVAVALAPNIERAISLPLEDVIAQMPEGYLKPRASFDVSRPVLLRAAEVERGLATGRPEIPVATLFQQAPDIFMHTVPSSDGAMIALPFDRVINALSNLALRRDQTAVQAVPQVETPFLQVTKEDTERFGVPLPSNTTPSFGPNASTAVDESPSVRIEAASAEAYAAATPEAADAFVPALDPESAQRIPFPAETETGRARDEKFGTGEPAFPRVPASSGPPVPPAPLSPRASISFDFPAPEENAEKLKSETQKSEIEGVGPVLTLPLRPILQSLPPAQVGGNPAAVPSDKTVSFPMSMIAPQLASGKVLLKPNAFYAALPEECRRLFLPHAVDAPVQLPLAAVLAHLPEEALRLREDQEEQRPDEVFETPFSAKAKEDAERFGAKGEPRPPTAATAAKAKEASERVAGKDEGGRMKDEGGKRKSENIEHRTSNIEHQKTEGGRPEAGSKFDAKEAVAKACAVSGVGSCSVIFSDGLSIAGNIPESVQADGLSAVAPTLLQKLGKHMLDTSFGGLRGMTVHGENSAVSFFAAGDVCLTAVHSGGELTSESRRHLNRITEEISRAYSQIVKS